MGGAARSHRMLVFQSDDSLSAAASSFRPDDRALPVDRRFGNGGRDRHLEHPFHRDAGLRSRLWDRVRFDADDPVPAGGRPHGHHGPDPGALHDGGRHRRAGGGPPGPRHRGDALHRHGRHPPAGHPGLELAHGRRRRGERLHPGRPGPRAGHPAGPSLRPDPGRHPPHGRDRLPALPGDVRHRDHPRSHLRPRNGGFPPRRPGPRDRGGDADGPRHLGAGLVRGAPAPDQPGPARGQDPFAREDRSPRHGPRDHGPGPDDGERRGPRAGVQRPGGDAARPRRRGPARPADLRGGPPSPDRAGAVR